MKHLNFSITDTLHKKLKLKAVTSNKKIKDLLPEIITNYLNNHS